LIRATRSPEGKTAVSHCANPICTVRFWSTVFSIGNRFGQTGETGRTDPKFLKKIKEKEKSKIPKSKMS